MRKRRLLIIVGSVAAIVALLFIANQWLIAKGQSLTFHMGANLERPEFVQVNRPFNVDVVYHVSDMLKGTNCYAWTVQHDVILRNDYDKDIRVHLPLLRASYWNPLSTQFIFNSDLDPEWKKSKNLTLKPGESLTISLPEGGLLTSDDLFARQKSKKCDRWALVFGVPDGEDSDKYLVRNGAVKPDRIPQRTQRQATRVDYSPRASANPKPASLHLDDGQLDFWLLH